MLTQEETPVYQTVKPATRKNYIMGIDPDSDKSGVAIWSRITDGYTALEVVDFAGFIDIIRFYAPDELLVVIEAGHKNPGFHHYDGLPKGFHTWLPRAQWGYMFNIGTRTGRNFGAGEYYKHFCQAHGYTVEDYIPNTPKWDHKYFSMITGIKKRFNQEVRDAVRCIHGR